MDADPYWAVYAREVRLLEEVVVRGAGFFLQSTFAGLHAITLRPGYSQSLKHADARIG
jgi:hypothetical protein